MTDESRAIWQRIIMLPLGHSAIVTAAEVAALGPADREWGTLDDLREDLGADWTFALDPDGSARFWRRDLEAERRIAIEESREDLFDISATQLAAELGYQGDL